MEEEQNTQPGVGNEGAPSEAPAEAIPAPESPTPEPTHNTHAVIIGVLVVLLVLVIGGLYLWGKTLSTVPESSQQEERVNNEPETTRAEADVEILNTLSTSDEIEAIEADLESTDLAELDAELESIEAELEF